MSMDKEKLLDNDSIDGALDRFWANRTLVGSNAFTFPHLGALKERLEFLSILYNGICPNEDCSLVNQGLEGVVLNLDDALFLGNNLEENLSRIYILWSCSRCAWAFIERK